MRTLILFSLSMGLTFAQATVNIKSLTFSADAVAATQSFMIAQTTGATTTLNGAITSGATTVTVQDNNVVLNNTAFVIDGEAFLVTARTAKVLTVTPAYLGTTTVAHADKAIVSVLKWATLILFGQQCIMDAVANIMNNPVYGYPTASIQNAVITTAQAAKNAAIAGAVQ